MTKEELGKLINETFANLLITQPLTKQETLNKINEVFDKLLIKEAK